MLSQRKSNRTRTRPIFFDPSPQSLKLRKERTMKVQPIQRVWLKYKKVMTKTQEQSKGKLKLKVVIPVTPFTLTDELDKQTFTEMTIRQVEPTSEEFKYIRKICCGRYIDRLFKVFHPQNLLRYEKKKEELLASASSDMSRYYERMLWHGTSKTDPFLIAQCGLDVRAGGGQIYGTESYRKALYTYSHGFTWSKCSEMIPNRMGKRRAVLLCRFLTGESDVNLYKSYKKSVQLQQLVPTGRFADSGYFHGLSAFSVYTNEQVYVNYIVVFRSAPE